MTHVSEGTLQAFLDGELPDRERAEVMRHLAGCADCAAELEVLRAAACDLSAALGWLDTPAPTATALASVRQVSSIPRIGPRFGFSDRAAGVAASTRRALVRAAMLVLGLAAAASAAIPGSPIRDWLMDTWQRVAGDDTVAVPTAPAMDPAVAPAAPATASAERMAGISILPRDGEIRIVLESPAHSSPIYVRLIDGSTASVFTNGDPGAASFRTAPGRITVANAGPEGVRVDLPRGAAAALLTVDGHAFAVKDADSLRAIAPAERASAEELVFRVGT